MTRVAGRRSTVPAVKHQAIEPVLPPSRQSAALGAGVRPLPAGGIFKSAAVEVLRRERRLMPTGEICRLALEWGLLNCSGKTPEATMASALYSDIKRKDRRSVFIRPQEGLFGLREWVDQGYLPHMPPNSMLMAITKRGMGQRPGVGRQKKVRRARAGDVDLEGQWTEEDEGGSSGEITPLQASMDYCFGGVKPPGMMSAAEGLQALGDVANLPLRKLLSQDPGTFAHAGLAVDGRQPNASHPAATLAPLVAPDLNPQQERSCPPAVNSHAADTTINISRRRLHLDLPCSATAEQLTSPPLYMALQSPLLPHGSSAYDSGQCKTGPLFTPNSFSAFSPGPNAAMPSLDSTPAALRSLLPGEKEVQMCTVRPRADRSTAGTAAVGQPALLMRGELPPAASWIMVPQPSCSRADVRVSTHREQVQGDPNAAVLIMPDDQQQQQQQQTPVGESAGGDALPALLYFDVGNLSTVLSGQNTTVSSFSLTHAADMSRGLESSKLRKIGELEAKVQNVEAQWGTHHPQTGRAYLLLYHACRHHHVADACRAKGEAALARACAILRANNPNGGYGSCAAADFAALLEGLNATSSSQWGGSAEPSDKQAAEKA